VARIDDEQHDADDPAGGPIELPLSRNFQTSPQLQESALTVGSEQWAKWQWAVGGGQHLVARRRQWNSGRAPTY